MVGAVLVTCTAAGEELPPPPPQEVTIAIAATLAKNLCILNPRLFNYRHAQKYLTSNITATKINRGFQARSAINRITMTRIGTR